MVKQNYSCSPPSSSSSSLRFPARIRANPLFWTHIRRHTKAQQEQPRNEEQAVITLKTKRDDDEIVIVPPHHKPPERVVIDLDEDEEEEEEEEENEHSSLSRKNPTLMLKEKQPINCVNNAANIAERRQLKAGKELLSTNKKYNNSWEPPNFHKHQYSYYCYSSQQQQQPASTSTPRRQLAQDQDVSTELGPSWVATDLTSLKHYSPEDEEKERQSGVSTRLKLYEDPWKIKKILDHSDVIISGNQCWMMVISGSVVREHVLKFLSANLVRVVESSPNGARFDFWDFDTKTQHKLVLKKLLATTYYVLIERWTQDFVRRRNLSNGDQIGFCWDTYLSRFNFCVLTRAAAADPLRPSSHHQIHYN